ncbi:MAG: DUF5666 domain-containing protein [Gaiellaceae bacterium]
MKKLIAFALTAICLAAVSVASADNGKRVGPLTGAIHADIAVLFVDGSTKDYTLDRGTVTAADASSLTLQRPDNQSFTFSLNADTWYPHGQPKIGDRLGVLAYNGTALRVNVWLKQSDVNAQAQDRVRAFAKAVHGDITLLMKDGTTKSETADRGRVTAFDANAGTMTIDRPDKQSVSFSVSSGTIVRHRGEDKSLADISIGDHVLVFANSGQALFIRDAGQAKKA